MNTPATPTTPPSAPPDSALPPNQVLLHLFRLCAQTPQGQLLLRAATRFHLGEPVA